jgi:serine/threonine-protein kinase
VYVRPFPGPGGKWQISNGGGTFPIWSPKARELFYLSVDRRIMVVTYTAKTDSFLADKPRPWSEKRLPDAGVGLIPGIAIAPDGKRFAILAPGDMTDDQKPPTQMIFLFNFFDKLRHDVPVR